MPRKGLWWPELSPQKAGNLPNAHIRVCVQRTPSILPSILTLSILPTLGYSVLPSKIPMLLTQAQGLTQMRFVK